MIRDIKDDVKKVLYSEEQLAKRVKEMAEEISKDYAGKDLLVVGILKGSVLFTSDLIKNISIPCEIDFMAVSSYGNGTKTSGAVKIIKDLDRNIEGYDLLIVEDILDSGKTLSYIQDILSARKPNSIRICTLFDKPDRRQVDLTAEYIGTEVPDEFIVGYGLDYAEKYRNLPFVGILKEYVYSD